MYLVLRVVLCSSADPWRMTLAGQVLVARQVHWDTHMEDRKSLVLMHNGQVQVAESTAVPVAVGSEDTEVFHLSWRDAHKIDQLKSEIDENPCSAAAGSCCWYNRHLAGRNFGDSD